MLASKPIADPDMSTPAQSTSAKLLVFILICGSAFTVYVLVAALIGWWVSDGAVIYELGLLPKRLLLDQFLFGMLQSLPVTIPLGVVAVLDYSILARFNGTRILSGLSLPIVVLALGYWWYQGDATTMMTLAVVGFILWLLFRFILIVCSRRTP